MKVRLGFVSNSSSSSFCLLGVYIGDDEKAKSRAYEIAKKGNLQVESGCDAYDDSMYVGLPPESMKDDETLLQFKQRVLDGLGEGYEMKDISWITDGGYSG